MFSIDEIKSSIQENREPDFIQFIREKLKKHSPDSHSTTDDICELLESLPSVLEVFLSVGELHYSENANNASRTLLQACLMYLKTSCAHGKALQQMIAEEEGLFDALKTILEHPQVEIPKKWTWHLLVNVIVDNPETLRLLWVKFGNYLLSKISEDHEYLVTNAAVLYNCFKISLEKDLEEIPTVEIIRSMIGVLERNAESTGSSQMEFVHLSFEYFITECDKFSEIYSQLTRNERLWTIFYITDHVKDERESQLSEEVLQCLPKEFNKRSECVLNNRGAGEDDPKEVMALLRCLVAISGNEKYRKICSRETSLFMNAGCLLGAVHSLSAQEGSAFSPLAKLEDFASGSEVGQAAEKEVFYELKSLLIRLLANLSHKNRKNQDLARELKILLTVCGCTTMDARNPMMKEWAIVALRNLLEGNADNQNIISSMVNTGPAANSVLSELTMEDGRLRINRNQKP